jgi:hypothetical protein
VQVNVYVDAFNLYRGGEEIAGKGVPGWRWLDIRALSQTIASAQWPNDQPQVQRVVYCTALVKALVWDPDLPVRQRSFIEALRRSGSVDWVEYGRFLDKVKLRPLAMRDRRGRPVIVNPARPVLIKDGRNQEINDAVFMVQVADREEKGSDVNIATHLLLDALSDPPAMDAAIVISNDSDLALPIAEVRTRMAVGIVNPGRGYTAGALQHDPTAAAFPHWERQLVVAELAAHQLPDPVGPHAKPPDW